MKRINCKTIRFQHVQTEIKTKYIGQKYIAFIPAPVAIACPVEVKNLVPPLDASMSESTPEDKHKSSLNL